MFKDVLKRLREERDMTQEQLGEFLGVTAGTIGNYEQGQRLPKDDKMWVKIATFFGVTVDYLMDVDDVLTSQSDKSNQKQSPLKTEVTTIMNQILETNENETELGRIKTILQTFL